MNQHTFRVAALLALFLPFLVPAAPAADGAGTFDPELAASVGADQYGMRSYVLVVLQTGPAEITDKEQRQKLFAGHFANMSRLAEEGMLVLAGPLVEGGDKRGIFILNVPTLEEARELVQTDPAVAAGIFVPDMTKFYGSAALMLLNDLHKKVQAESIG